jgi:hypothetical protein
MDQLNKLKNRVLKKQPKYTELTGVLDFMRGMGCFSDIIGRDFEVFDKKGELLYRIRQKPLSIPQVRTLIKEYGILKQLDNEIEAKKWGKK